MLPALHQHPLRPRVGEGPDRRAHPRDLPADRPLAARGDRLQGARREHHRARLRRAAGRRRHPHRGDHRRVRRARRRGARTSQAHGALKGEPLTGSVAAISVGIIDGEPRLDLPYEEDVRAETDMNVVMTGDGAFVEVQGTAEGAPFDRAMLDSLLDAGREGLRGPHRDSSGRPSPDDPGLPRVPQRRRSSSRCAASCVEYVPDVEVLGLDDVDAVRRAGGDRADVRGQRAAQGARRRRGDRAAVAGRRQRALRRRAQRHARRAVRAVGRRRQGRRGRNNRLLLEQLADVPDERAGRALHRRGRVRLPGRRGRHRGARRARRDARPDHPRDARGAAASATTCCSWPTATSARSAELSVEEKDAISHRGKALREIAPVVADVLTGL